MKLHPLTALCLSAAAMSAAAGPAVSQPAPIASHAPDLDKVAGVYKHRFANGEISGGEYISEDVFELVKLSPRTAYFRIHSEFYNGHICALWGVADLERDALTYHGQIDYDGRPCVLKFTVNKDGIITNDVGGACRAQSCGARGGFGAGDEVSYPFKARRRIRYMARLLASSQYASAVKEHRAHPPGTPSPHDP